MKLILSYLLLVCHFFLISPIYGEPTRHIRDLLNAKPDSNIVKALSDLCWDYRFKSADSALLFGGHALDLAGKIGYQKGIAQAYNDMAIIYIDRANYHRASKYLNEAMKIRIKMNDQSGMASLYNKLGIIDQKQGRLKDALENQLSALKIYQKLGQDKLIGHTYNNIAIIHQNLDNPEKALEYHTKALEYRMKLNDKMGEATSYSNMANLFARIHDTISAVTFYQKALDMARSLKNEELISGNLSNISNIYMGRKEYGTALKHYEESLAIREKLGDSKGISSTLSRIGTVYTETGRYREASGVLYRSLKIARDISVVEEEMSALLGLAKLKALTHQLDSSFVLMKEYVNMKDSVYNARIKQQILDVQSQYETDQLEQGLELMRKEKENTEIKLRQRKTELLLAIIILISITGAGIFEFYRYRQGQKAAATAEKLNEQEIRINAVLEAQEDERRRIAKELHDGVGQTLSAIMLNYQSLRARLTAEKRAPEYQKIEKMLDQVGSEVRSISHQMIPKELEQFGLLPAIEEMLKMNLENSHIQYLFENSGWSGRLSDSVELAIFRILQELVSNCIKHSGAGLLSVQLLRLPAHVVLAVSDDGVGFDVANKEKNGIGLLNIASRVDAVKGHLFYESTPETGTTATIRIPIV